MDWAAEIERNRQRLIGIVATLIAMVGLDGGSGLVRIGREVRLEVLRTLRPAEAAMRRLIVMAARGLVLKPIVHRPMPPGLAKHLRTLRKGRALRPRFALADPQMPMVAPARRVYFKQGPRISFIAPDDPTVTAIFQAAAVAVPARVAKEAEEVDVNPALLRRLEAIKLALEDVPGQARRLLRWRARREKIAAVRPISCSPLRPGTAPYLPKTPVSDVDCVLERCHLLARDALRADTS